MIFKQTSLFESVSGRLSVFTGGSGGLGLRATTTGGDRVRQALKKLGQAPQKALDLTAEQVETLIERDVKKHSKSGDLFASIGKKRITPSGWIVGHDTQRAKHALFVHWGTRAHIIKPKKKKALRWVAGNNFAFAKKVRHPGNKADPWFVRAASQAPLMFQRHVERILAERQGRDLSSTMQRAPRRALAALHPVAAAVNRRRLTPDELRAIEVAQSLAVAAVASGRATWAECRDVHDLLRIGLELGRMGVGAELVDELRPVLADVRQALAQPVPVVALAALLPRLLPVLGPLGEQRGMATLAEWRRAQALRAMGAGHA